MRRVSGCCGTDWHLISSDQHVFFLVFWLLLPLALRCCFQSRGFLQLLFQGSGILADDRAMILAATIRVRPLLVILFMLLSEISSVLPNATGWSYVTCSVLTVSASDAVRCVCFGVLYSRSSFWFLPHGGKFLRGLALPAQVWLSSYSEGDLPPCCEFAWLQVLWDGPQFPSSGMFHSTSMRCFQTQVHSFVMICSIGSCLRFVCSDQGGSRQLMSSSIICHLWLLGDHRGAWFPNVGSWLLFFRNTSAAARRASTATLSAFFSSLSASVCTCVTCRGEHSSSASPVWWLTFYFRLRAALQWLLSSLTVLL